MLRRKFNILASILMQLRRQTTSKTRFFGELQYVTIFFKTGPNVFIKIPSFT